MYMGQNRISKNFIFYDRKAATSPNGFILGKPGRGKSVNAKYFIENVLLSDPDADVIVIDPERGVPRHRARVRGRGRGRLGELGHLHQPLRPRGRVGRGPAARHEDRRHHLHGGADGQEPHRAPENARGPLGDHRLRAVLRDEGPRRHPHARGVPRHPQRPARGRGRAARHHHRALHLRAGEPVLPPHQRGHQLAVRGLRRARPRGQHEGPRAAHPARRHVAAHRAQPRAPRAHVGVHRRDAASALQRLRRGLLRHALDAQPQVRRDPHGHHAERRAPRQ